MNNIQKRKKSLIGASDMLKSVNDRLGGKILLPPTVIFVVIMIMVIPSSRSRPIINDIIDMIKQKMRGIEKEKEKDKERKEQ